MSNPRSALFALTAAGALVLSACGSSSESAESSTTSSAAAGGDSSSVNLVTPGKLTVCTHLSFAPFQFPDDSGNVVGFDVDLVDLVAAELGVEQEIVDTPFEGIKSGQVTATDKCDLSAAGMTILPEREKAMLFSDPYLDVTQALLVKADSDITGMEDLAGKKLGGQAGTTGLDYANEHAEEFGYEIVEYTDSTSQQQALVTNQVDAIINDQPVVGYYSVQNPGTTKIATQFQTGERYGFGMKLGNDALKKVVDEVLAKAKKDGTYEAIATEWLGSVPSA